MIDAKQSRAARALLGWSQTQLAEASNLGITTLNNFESERKNPTPNNLAAIRRALETAGISFDDEPNAPGVKLRITGNGRRSA